MKQKSIEPRMFKNRNIRHVHKCKQTLIAKYIVPFGKWHLFLSVTTVKEISVLKTTDKYKF